MRFDDSIFAISSVVSCRNFASSILAFSCDLSDSCSLRQHAQTRFGRAAMRQHLMLQLVLEGRGKHVGEELQQHGQRELHERNNLMSWQVSIALC